MARDRVRRVLVGLFPLSGPSETLLGSRETRNEPRDTLEESPATLFGSCEIRFGSPETLSGPLERQNRSWEGGILALVVFPL